MKKVVLIQMALTSMGTILIILLDAKRNGISYLLGSGLILLNLWLLSWVWTKILQKKLIALSTMIIVFKYAIFGAVIYKILTWSEVNSAWFSVGLSTLIATVIIYPFFSLE